jgi:hypothetical protein
MPLSPELAQLDGPDLLGVSILMEFYRAEKAFGDESFEPSDTHRLSFSVTIPDIFSGSTSISQLTKEKWPRKDTVYLSVLT